MYIYFFTFTEEKVKFYRKEKYCLSFREHEFCIQERVVGVTMLLDMDFGSPQDHCYFKLAVLLILSKCFW